MSQPGSQPGSQPAPPDSVTVLPVAGIGEVVDGTDLASAIAERVSLCHDDVVVVTSKVVSKAEGRVVPGTREEWLAAQTDRVVARRGPTTIVRTPSGLVMAAAGIDASNVAAGFVVLLPEDPDRSARLLRERLAAAYGVNVAVLVSDTSGRAWRAGQTDIAIGAAGLEVLQDHAGRVDAHGNPLRVTAPALADELAGAGDLVKGKLAGRPAAVIRGMADLVLAPGDHGAGARALVRAEQDDLFGYGAREAVLQAVLGARSGKWTARGFGPPASAQELATVLAVLLEDRGMVRHRNGELVISRMTPRSDADAADLALIGVLARAHGWDVGEFAPDSAPQDVVLRRIDAS